MTTNHDAEARPCATCPPSPRPTWPPCTTGWPSAPTADGVLDVAYRTLDTPVGTLLLAATETGLVRVAYPIEGHDQVLQALAARVSPRILRAPAARRRRARDRRVLRRPAPQLRPAAGLPPGHGFPPSGARPTCPASATGSTASYATVAAAVGSPRAFRAVGTACATNPLPVVLPCHRVIKSDGDLGRYRGGPAAKRLLLNLEAA